MGDYLNENEMLYTATLVLIVIFHVAVLTCLFVVGCDDSGEGSDHVRPVTFRSTKNDAYKV